MNDLDAIRARYRAHKGGCAHNTGIRKRASLVSRRAKADARARQFIERCLAGETRKQIAESLGIDASCVTSAIRKYLERHPSARSPSKKEQHD